MGFGLKREPPLVNLFDVGDRGHGGGKLDFEKLAADFGRKKTGWSVPEAYLGLLIATAMADGNYHPEEQQEVLKLGRRSRVLNELSVQDLAAANDIVNERLQARPEALREACQTIPEDMRLSLFGHCVGIAIADGELHKAEALFLERLVEDLGLDTSDARQVLEVVLLIARY